MKLVIASKNYSSWSMRPWVLMRELGVAFEEHVLALDQNPGSPFRVTLAGLTPAGKVPVLMADDGRVIWDSMAIVETLHEMFPTHGIWPTDPGQRARARSLVAEMHSGFETLRKVCPMHIDADLRELGAKEWKKREALRADVAALTQRWTNALQASGGPYLFGAFCAVDAFYAPVATRFRTYGLPVSDIAEDYVDRLWQTPSVQTWVREARAENHFPSYLDRLWQAGPSPA